MTQNRLDELNKKIENKTIEISELAEICSACLESVSRHSKEIKISLKSINDEILELKEKIQDMKNDSSLGFGIILDEED